MRSWFWRFDELGCSQGRQVVASPTPKVLIWVHIMEKHFHIRLILVRVVMNFCCDKKYLVITCNSIWIMFLNEGMLIMQKYHNLQHKVFAMFFKVIVCCDGIFMFSMSLIYLFVIKISYFSHCIETLPIRGLFSFQFII